MSTTSSIGSPLRTIVRGFSRAIITVRPAPRLLPRPCSSASVPTSTANSLTSSVIAGGASIVKCTTTSEPSASRRSTVERDAPLGRGVGHERGVLHVLRADAEHDGAALVAPQAGPRGEDLGRDGQSEAAELDGQRRRPYARQRGVDEVHRRRADEAGDEEVDGVLVERLGLVDLLQHALAEHRDPVAHGHRLGLVVRDVDRRDAQLVLDAGDLGPHLHAQLGVEVRERLVHEERLGVAHDGAAHRHPLALAARQRSRLAVQELRRARGCARRRAPAR